MIETLLGKLVFGDDAGIPEELQEVVDKCTADLQKKAIDESRQLIPCPRYLFGHVTNSDATVTLIRKIHKEGPREINLWLATCTDKHASDNEADFYVVAALQRIGGRNGKLVDYTAHTTGNLAVAMKAFHKLLSKHLPDASPDTFPAGD